jgi:transposase InsO family protein
MKTELVLKALIMAENQRFSKETKTIHHSDRGSQYASHEYQNKLLDYGITSSMSRKGNCWDNAVAESFFHTLKTEHIYFQNFQTREEAKLSIFEWTECFYNRQRLHSSLEFCTPEEYASFGYRNVA